MSFREDYAKREIKSILLKIHNQLSEKQEGVQDTLREKGCILFNSKYYHALGANAAYNDALILIEEEYLKL